MSIIKNGKEYLQGDGTWGFEVMVDGDDLVMNNVTATCWGTDDPDDSGVAASGINTQKFGPLYPMCALPMAIGKVCVGSPLPDIRPNRHWGNHVTNIAEFLEVQVESVSGNEGTTTFCVDIGPSKNTKDPRAIDLSVKAIRNLGYNGVANDFQAKVNVRIINGNKHRLENDR